MALLCGWASQDERKKISGGKAGDQTGGEVKLGDWYNFKQTTLLRFVDRAKAVRAAAAMRSLCQNPAVGYDQNQRTTLYSELQKLGMDYTRLATPCECDCSSLIAVCCIVAGVKVSKDIYTGNMVDALAKTGDFLISTDNKYISSSQRLVMGDVLVRPGHHTIMVLEDGTNAASELGYNPSASVTPPPKEATGGLVISRYLRYKSPMMRGEDVRWMQRVLIGQGIGIGDSGDDAIFGRDTDAGVREFQRRKKLEIDGVVGANTVAAMGGEWRG